MVGWYRNHTASMSPVCFVRRRKLTRNRTIKPALNYARFNVGQDITGVFHPRFTI